MRAIINSKNILGWLRLFRDILDLSDKQKESLDKFLKRTDVVRRQKEIDEIFGGEEEW